MNILHISDLHFGPRHWDGNDKLLLEKINSFVADLVINTGDNTTDGLESEFAQAGNFLKEIKSVFTASIHCDPTNEYPYFWGYADEKGKGQALGTNHNEPLPKDTQLAPYSVAVDRILSKIRAFKPAYLIIAAGFDTHIDDSIGGFQLQTEDYISIGKQFKSLDIPTLVCQEGGYNVDNLGNCAKNFLLGLM